MTPGQSKEEEASSSAAAVPASPQIEGFLLFWSAAAELIRELFGFYVKVIDS